MHSSQVPQIQDHLVFPTRVSTLEFPDTAAMDAELLAVFDGNDAYQRAEYLETADNSNLLRLCESVPAVAQLRDLFLVGLRHWMRAEGIEGRYRAEMLMFPVYSLPKQFVPAHNHLAHVSGVYYVRTDDFGDRPVVEYGGTAEYFRSEGGVLLLHDPRFNALLLDLSKKDSIKICPRPGLMVLMPGYLWHSGLPNYGQRNRLAIVGDFILHEHESSGKRVWSFDLGSGAE